MLKERVLTALAGLPIFIFFIYQGGYWMFGAILVLTLIGSYEFFHAFQNIEIHPFMITGMLGSLVQTFCFMQEYYLYGLLAHFVILAVNFLILIFHQKHTVMDLIVTHFGIFMISLIIPLFYLLRMSENGLKYVLLPFIIAWGSDIFAYFVGINFGKHKLCPEISPKKSVEGAIGGIVGSMVCVTIYHLAMHFQSNLILTILMGGVLSAAAQVGDLAFSMIKRYCKIKDFGKLLPGHGGILDRFDSVFFVTPMIYGLVLLFFA